MTGAKKWLLQTDVCGREHDFICKDVATVTKKRKIVQHLFANRQWRNQFSQNQTK